MRTKFWILTLLVVTFISSIYSLTSQTPPVSAATPAPTSAATMSSMGGGMTMESGYSTNDLAPLAKAYYSGKEVYFIHPEASDAGVAAVLTKMMGPQVLTVPGLAKIPSDLLANVYVFANGIKGMGPLGFQPDVFDSVPGDKNYTPLRTISLITWKVTATAKELTSVEDIMTAQSAGQVEIKHPGVVVNMPILVWPGGKR
jgi:hypothetical protein